MLVQRELVFRPRSRSVRPPDHVLDSTDWIDPLSRPRSKEDKIENDSSHHSLFPHVPVHEEPLKSIQILIVPGRSGQEISRLEVFYDGVVRVIDDEANIASLSFHLKEPHELGHKDRKKKKKGLYQALLALAGSDAEVQSLVEGIVCYLSFFALAEMESFHDLLPLHFSIPALTEGNLMNENMFHYMEVPLHSLHHVATSPLQDLVGAILNFINRWGHLFQEGPVVDRSRVIMETMAGTVRAHSIILQSKVDQIHRDLHISSRHSIARAEAQIKENCLRDLGGVVEKQIQSAQGLIQRHGSEQLDKMSQVMTNIMAAEQRMLQMLGKFEHQTVERIHHTELRLDEIAASLDRKTLQLEQEFQDKAALFNQELHETMQKLAEQAGTHLNEVNRQSSEQFSSTSRSLNQEVTERHQEIAGQLSSLETRFSQINPKQILDQLQADIDHRLNQAKEEMVAETSHLDHLIHGHVDAILRDRIDSVVRHYTGHLDHLNQTINQRALEEPEFEPPQESEPPERTPDFSPNSGRSELSSRSYHRASPPASPPSSPARTASPPPFYSRPISPPTSRSERSSRSPEPHDRYYEKSSEQTYQVKDSYSASQSGSVSEVGQIQAPVWEGDQPRSRPQRPTYIVRSSRAH
jgi:hypothetical protein